MAAIPLAAVACDGDDEEDVGTGSAALAEACGRIFDAARNVSDRCLYGAPLVDQLRPSEREGYVRFCSGLFGLPGVVADVPSRLARCASTISASSCGALFADSNLGCAEFERATGTFAAGAACDEDVQCASGTCERPTDVACGACAREVGEGESCDGDGVTCGPGLSCRRPDGGGGETCQRPRRAGEACNGDCETGSLCDGGVCKATAALPKAGEACAQYCAYGNVCLGATCVALPKENEACLANDKGDDCALGLACDEATKLCRRRFTGEVDPGGACDKDTYCKGGHCAGGRCVAYAKIGEACSRGEGQNDAGAAPLCAQGHDCKAGTCAEWAPACPAGN